MTNKELIIGIDASRNRSGGAKSHLVGILDKVDPRDHGVSEVHVWGYRALLDAIPDRSWLYKHNPPDLERGLLYQVLWQIFKFPGEFSKFDCKILLNTDAGAMSRLRPSVTMSRDMLSYEPGEIERYGWSKARLRLILLRYIQNWSLRRADGVIFLTRYASHVIQRSSGPIRRMNLVPHGVGQNFLTMRHVLHWPLDGERPIRVLYISNAAFYKHQWMVVRAVQQLRNLGHDVTLTLVGGGKGPAMKRLRAQIKLSDPLGQFVIQKEFVPQAELPDYLVNADIFVFASSCENMPNTLLEAMAVGLPIACSLRGPMPEILKDGGEYFDPEDPDSIAYALKKLISDAALRQRYAVKAKTIASNYSWERCARQTWSFIVETYENLSAVNK